MSDAPVVYTENGVGIYRASGIGMCERALIAARMGMTPASPPPWMLERFQEGHDAEPKILAEVRRQTGSEVHNQQAEVEIPVGKFAIIRGHIDGTNKMRLVEAKKFRRSLFEVWSRGLDAFWEHCPYYRDQLTIYMDGTQLPALYAVLEWETGEVHIKEIPEPPGDINEIVARVLRIELEGRKGALPRECEGKTWPCPFYYLPGHSKEAKPDNSEDFDVLAKEAAEAREDKKRAEERAKEANKQMLEYLRGQGVDTGSKIDNGEYVANRVGSSSVSFDRQAMKDDEVYEKYMVKKEYEYALVKRKEE